MTNPLPLQPIHPFPARMAPEIALAHAKSLDAGSIVLDPMAGSGTVLRVAAAHGHRTLGLDMDPLAVLMAQVWTTPIDIVQLRATARDVIDRVEAMDARDVVLSWIDEDQPTRKYVDFWFGPRQQPNLRKLSYKLHDLND